MTYLLPTISELYGLEGYEFKPVKKQEGGQNVVYSCEKDGATATMIRISCFDRRSKEEVLAEVEYIRYLAEHSASVSDVVASVKGNLLEEITYEKLTYYVCLFEKAKGKKLVDNNYRYREGVPITEYYYNCGKVLGRLHQLSKGYDPVHRRPSFFDKFNVEYINNLIPSSLSLLKERLIELLRTLENVERDQENFGMIHFDYNDGNYVIDYDTGQITVYDFDNSCFGWYMYDLADLWRSGMGWIAAEPDAAKRRRFMDDYFEIALDGYRSETSITSSMLERLPLFINAIVMEQIVDELETMRYDGQALQCDEELSYLIKCLEDDIPFLGFFHDMYSCEEPFEYEGRELF